MTYQDVTEQAFLDELEKIGGILGGVSKFFSGGARGFGQLGSQAGRAGLWQQTKNLPGRLGKAWEHGGVGGVGKALLRSQPVQMAALGAGGLYAGSKAVGALRGNDRQQQQR